MVSVWVVGFGCGWVWATEMCTDYGSQKVLNLVADTYLDGDGLDIHAAFESPVYRWFATMGQINWAVDFTISGWTLQVVGH